MNRNKIFTYFGICFLLGLTWTTVCFSSAVDAANAGMQALKAGDKEKAKVLFTSALKSNELSKENYIIVNNQLGDVLRSESKYDQALKCYSESLYLDPDNPAARWRRGTLYQHMGRYDNAVEDLTRYTELIPKDPKGYIHRGLAFRELGNYDRALSDLDHAVWLRPKNEDAYIHRGNTFSRAGNHNLALADFDQAVKLDPDNPYAYQAMAWFYAACPNTDYRDGKKAVDLAKKALKLEKAGAPASIFQATLAAAYAQSKMYGKAVDIQSQAVASKTVNKSGFHFSKTELRRQLRLYNQGLAYRAR